MLKNNFQFSFLLHLDWNFHHDCYQRCKQYLILCEKEKGNIPLRGGKTRRQEEIFHGFNRTKKELSNIYLNVLWTFPHDQTYNSSDGFPDTFCFFKNPLDFAPNFLNAFYNLSLFQILRFMVLLPSSDRVRILHFWGDGNFDFNSVLRLK